MPREDYHFKTLFKTNYSRRPDRFYPEPELISICIWHCSLREMIENEARFLNFGTYERTIELAGDLQTNEKIDAWIKRDIDFLRRLDFKSLVLLKTIARIGYEQLGEKTHIYDVEKLEMWANNFNYSLSCKNPTEKEELIKQITGEKIEHFDRYFWSYNPVFVLPVELAP